MLQQVQQSRWSPKAWSIGILLQTVHPRLAGGFISVELAAAAASIFVLDCPRADVAPGVCQPRPTSPPPACRRLLWNLLGRAPE